MLKPIPGFPDYFASDDGNIWSRHPRAAGPKGLYESTHELQQLKPDTSGPLRSNYRRVTLCVDGRHFHKKIAYCVLVAFVGNRPKGMVICHGPNGRFDDSLPNLSWGTPGKNSGEDRIRDGTILSGQESPIRKLNSWQVRIIRRAYSSYGRIGLTSKTLGVLFGITRENVMCIVNRKTWKHV